MKNEKKHKTNGNGQTCKPLHVEFSDPSVETVAIAGSFNNWRPEATPMVSLGNGRWLKELVLPPGHYEYLLVADGRWLPDPTNAMDLARNTGWVEEPPSSVWAVVKVSV